MTYQLAYKHDHEDVRRVIEALAPRTRWDIFTCLRKRPHSVGEIARILPVSRPAVSQHLKILKAAGLVREEAQGVRHIYAAQPQALYILRSWLDGFWDQALDNMKETMEKDDD